MAKKSNRVLCLVLTVLMIVGMIPVANAQYVYNAASTKDPYYSVSYDTLVGPAYENNKGVYIVNTAWKFEEGKEPKTVTFNYRGKEYTENYNPDRHLYVFSDVYVKAKAQGISLPTCILTEGNYSGNGTLTLSGSIILLGAKAGINPNVENSDPTKPWSLNPQRYYDSALDNEETGGESRLWNPGSIVPEVGYVEGSASNYTDKILKITQSAGTGTFVIDGLSFLGYGACLDATANGSGTWNVYVQNCVFGDCYSYDTETLRFWNRGASMSIAKKLYLSNSYVSDNTRNGFYSGHAQSIQINGLYVQNNQNTLFYNIQNIPWQGYNFSCENSHFWNEQNVAGKSIHMFDFNMTSYSYVGPGGESDAYNYLIKNNSFYNVTSVEPVYAVDETTGDTTEELLGYSRRSSINNSIADIIIGGENDFFTFEDNYIVSTADYVEDTEMDNLLNLYLLCDKNSGKVSHGWADSSSTHTNMDADFVLDPDQVKIRNNTIIGKSYMASMLTYRGGTVLNEANRVTMEGNLYLPTLDATEGQIVTSINAFGDQIFDQWVWLDKAMTKKSSELNESEFSCTTAGIEKNGTDWMLPLAYDVMSVDLDFTHNEKNDVVIYKSDETFTKGTALADYTLDTSERTSYYVISLFSIDGRTTKDYHLTVKRAANPAAGLVDVTPAPSMAATQKEEYGDSGYRFEVNYDNQSFQFAVEATEGATVVVKNKGSGTALSKNGDYFIANLRNTLSNYEYIILVTDAEGNAEKYPLVLYRRLSTHAEITEFTSDDDCVITDDSSNLTWRIEADATASEVNFNVKISTNATAVLTDSIYGVNINPVSEKATKLGYTVDVSAGETIYNLTITAQDGETQKVWKIIVSRPKNIECELISLDDAELKSGVYVANVATKNFFVNVVSSTASTYHVYSDEACLNEIVNPYLTLTEAVTTVWVQVHAEDTNYKSVPVKLVINTTADLSNQKDSVVYAPMGYDGIVGVTGATEFSGNIIWVELDENVSEFFLKVVGLNGHSVYLFADETCTIAVPLESVMKLDGGYTCLYLMAAKGDDVYFYILNISSPRYAEYTDTLTSWAAPYVEALNESGLGLMRGDENGAFNGESKLTRYEMAAMIVRLRGANKNLYAKCELVFMDDIVSWAKNYVKAAYQLGLINGYAVKEDGEIIGYTFEGEREATRAEFTRVLLNALTYDIDAFYEENKEEIDAEVAATELKDLDSVAKWSKSAIYTAVALGLISGDQNGNVNADKVITRNEAATIMVRLF